MSKPKINLWKKDASASKLEEVHKPMALQIATEWVENGNLNVTDADLEYALDIAAFVWENNRTKDNAYLLSACSAAYASKNDDVYTRTYPTDSYATYNYRKYAEHQLQLIKRDSL